MSLESDALVVFGATGDLAYRKIFPARRQCGTGVARDRTGAADGRRRRAGGQLCPGEMGPGQGRAFLRWRRRRARSPARAGRAMPGANTVPLMRDVVFLLDVDNTLLDHRFAQRWYPDALATIAHLATFGLPVVLPDGDRVFQPRKMQRLGIWDAVAGGVLIPQHKAHALNAMQRRYPASRDVMIDDKLDLLAAIKQALGPRLTTTLVRQGHYARESAKGARLHPRPLCRAYWRTARVRSFGVRWGAERAPRCTFLKAPAEAGLKSFDPVRLFTPDYAGQTCANAKNRLPIGCILKLLKGSCGKVAGFFAIDDSGRPLIESGKYGAACRGSHGRASLVRHPQYHCYQ